MVRFAALAMLALAVIACGGQQRGAGRPAPVVPHGLISYHEGKRLMVAHLDWSDPRRIATLAAAPDAAAWSPDASRLLVSAGGRLAIVGRNGKLVGTPPGKLLSGSWAPDGHLVATDATTGDPCTRPHRTLRLAIATAAGRLVRDVALGHGERRLITAVTWAPDSRRVSYTTAAVDCEEARAGEGAPIVGVVDVHDGARRTVFQRTRVWTDVRAPAWSPDGRRIAFAMGCHGSITRPEGYPPADRCRIVTVYVARTRSHGIDPEYALADGLAWTHDGRVVVITVDPAGVRALDPRTGHGVWLARPRRPGQIEDAAAAVFEESRDRVELITSAATAWSPSGGPGIVVTNLRTHEIREYAWRDSVLDVFAAGFSAR